MQPSALYNDFNSIAELRADARLDPNAALESVAAQFESLFVQMMLKSMRDATIEGGLFQSNQLDTYQQMSDQQLSLDISDKGGIGLAEVLIKQLSGPAKPQSNELNHIRGRSAVKEFSQLVAKPVGTVQVSV